MRQIKAGIMISQIRRQKKIRQEELCAGICRKDALSRYESGKRVPDGLLFHCFMQRLGMNAGDFSIMLSLKEYRYYMWKEMVFDAIQKQDWKMVEDLYHENQAGDRSCNAKFQNQFYQYMASVLAEKVENNEEKALWLLQEAISGTVPDYRNDRWKAYRLSVFEIGLMALYYYKGGMLQLLPSEKVHSNLKSLIDYTMQKVADKQECARLVPGMVCALLNLGREQMDLAERLALEEEAVKLLKESYSLYHLPELLRLYIEDLRLADKEKAHRYEMQYHAFIEMFRDAGYDTAFQPELLFDGRRQIYLLNEYMRSHREISGLTQEKVCEDICAVGTYSRLETGKRMPRLREGEAIFERLKIGWGYFRAILETTDYRAFEYLHQFRKAAREGEWKTAEKLMEKIKENLDMESINNRQYIGMMENRLAYAAGRMDTDEFYRKDKELLELSVREEDLEKTELYYFSHIEIALYSHLANALKVQGKQEQGIELIKNVLKKMEKSQVGLEYWWESIKALIFNLANMLSDIGDYSASLEYMTDFISKCFKLYDGKFTAYGIGERALDLEQLGRTNKATCDRLLVQVLYLTDFYGLTENHNRLLKHYVEYYDDKRKWY